MAIYNGKATVTITCASQDATILYTVTNEEVPQSIYGGPFEVYKNCTVKAMATKEGASNSDIASASCQVKVTADTQYIKVTKNSNNDAAAIEFDPQIVTDLAKHGANLKIRYTLDGSDPTASSTLFDISSSITVGNCTFKYKYFTDECEPSDTMSEVISGLKVATPVITFA